ncbi:SGNH/GDSL hydrolase family protein [Paucibacter sp. TC2R-5]|uniref:SGNH/GDSL hydrolase family protein n=1 Tax=Paucibacter sp. TC2R-5 TaxID=2893555 RepID=UPI0021E4E44E|nr:SGNH/GDSL hydrolase family protein [Paucibacter sp. TC2R-5]MCV2358306.1 SGNH/GDSL hydrolase family protein [Paucibacter sp. TC2R-5]
MQHSILARATAALLLAGGMTMAALPAHALSYSKVVAFGDSLSDNGNFLLATGGALPQAPYYNGRFSNGQVAVEYLAQGLGVALNDYAYGGAETGLLNGAAVAAGIPGPLQNTGVLSQVGAFKAGLGGASADANALYFLWAGANDFEYQGFTAAVAQTAINNLSTGVQTLYGLGARNFLLPGLADLGFTPRGLASGQSSSLQLLSMGFNQGLGLAIDQLRLMPGVHISYFDIFASQHDLIANPASYGLSNVTDACFSGSVGKPGLSCADPASYMYWDDLHPSALTHQILGQKMLAAVPEPQTMLLMAVGLLALLTIGRKNRC